MDKTIKKLIKVPYKRVPTFLAEIICLLFNIASYIEHVPNWQKVFAGRIIK